ncbi:hypothetical protein D3C77_682810 [compost metagenome]
MGGHFLIAKLLRKTFKKLDQIKEVTATINNNAVVTGVIIQVRPKGPVVVKKDQFYLR